MDNLTKCNTSMKNLIFVIFNWLVLQINIVKSHSVYGAKRACQVFILILLEHMIFGGLNQCLPYLLRNDLPLQIDK